MTGSKNKKKQKKLPKWMEKQPPYEIGKDGFSPKDLKTDIDGWIDPEFAKPYPYDLARIKLWRKTISGWWNGQKWEALQLLPDDKILYWKQKEDTGDHE